MSHGHQQPSRRRNGRRHSPHRERSWRRRFKERFKEEYDALKRKARWKAIDWAFLFVKYAALEWKPRKPLPELPSHSHKRYPEPNKHHPHRERSPELRGRRRCHHGSRRELRDASYHRWPHGSSISTPRPRPKSPHSQARSHTRRPTRLSEDDEDFGDIGAYRHEVLHTGFDPPRPTRPKSPHSQARPHMRRPTRLSEGDKDFWHVRVYGHGVPYPGFDSFDTRGDSDGDDHTPSDSENGYDSDLSEALSGSGTDYNEGLDVVTPSDSEGESTASLRSPQPEPQWVPTTGFDHFDTLGGLDDDDHGPLTHTPSDSEDGYDSDLSEALSGLGIDHNDGLDVVTPSDSEEESTASLRGPQPQPQGVPTTDFKHTSTNPNRDRAKDRPDVSPSLHTTLDTDFNDTAPESDEDDAGDSFDTPPSSYKISDEDEDEDSDLRSCLSDSDGDEEEIAHQAAILPLQVVKVDLGDTLPNSGENRDAPPSSNPPDPSEDYQVENILNAVTSLHQVAHVDLGDSYSDSDESQYHSDFDESEDEDPATDLSAALIDASPEGEGEVDDSLDQDAITPPITSPEKLERASAIASVALPLSQEDVTGPGDSKAESAASHNASGTETPGPQPQPSSLAKPSSTKAVCSTKGQVAPRAKSPINLYPGLIVRRQVGEDKHPHLITQKVQHKGNPAVVAHPCTSRPKKWKFRNQYQEQTEKHYCYLGGIKGKHFETDGIPKPKVAELDIQGPPMPYKTYIKLEEYEPFDPNDFVPFGRKKRQLPPESLEKFLNLYRPTRLQKSPPGSVLAAQPEILM